MGTINGLYIFVENEDLSYGVNVTEHTVEEGIEISDHVKRNAMTLSLSGEIVGKNAASTQAQIKKMHQSGVVCKYSGRTVLSNCLITDFSTSHPNTIWGGCSFSMTLKEIRTASTTYKKTATATANKTKSTKKTGTQQKTTKSKVANVTHKVKKGDTVWALVAASNAPYKNLSRPKINGKSYSACDWVMQQNPSAFSKKGDFRTLQIGKNLIVGQR